MTEPSVNMIIEFGLGNVSGFVVLHVYRLSNLVELVMSLGIDSIDLIF